MKSQQEAHEDKEEEKLGELENKIGNALLIAELDF